MLEAQLRNPAQRFMARVRQVCYEVMRNTNITKSPSHLCNVWDAPQPKLPKHYPDNKPPKQMCCNTSHFWVL